MASTSASTWEANAHYHHLHIPNLQTAHALQSYIHHFDAEAMPAATSTFLDAWSVEFIGSSAAIADMLVNAAQPLAQRPSTHSRSASHVRGVSSKLLVEQQI